ncbi:hypothetical protein BGX26_002949 [Mortierella sp. AD094]|nr:hypothetical protein BGX26_002949 [Mortierella sp. AD094]
MLCRVHGFPHTLSTRRVGDEPTTLGHPWVAPLESHWSAPVFKQENALKVLLQGDTHLQAAIEHLLRRLDGVNEIHTSIAAATSRTEKTLGSTTFSYINDPLLSRPIKKSDILVANMGQMATGTKYLKSLMSTSTYHKTIQHLVSTIQQRVRDVQDEDFMENSHLIIGEQSKQSDSYVFDDEEVEFELEMEKETQRHAHRYNDEESEREEQLQQRVGDKVDSKDSAGGHQFIIQKNIGGTGSGDSSNSHLAPSRDSNNSNNDSSESTTTHNQSNTDTYKDRKIKHPENGINASRGTNTGNSGKRDRKGEDRQRLTRRSVESPPQMIWAGMVAFPETQPVDSLLRHDWRTIYRLRYWNQIAEDVMLLNNVPFMDFFSMVNTKALLLNDSV